MPSTIASTDGGNASTGVANLFGAYLALGIVGFAIGTGEFVIMGLLPNVATDLGTSISSAGHLISAYAIGVMVGAPLFAVLGARVPRRMLLIFLTGFYAAANLATVAAAGEIPITISRFFSGLPHGAYFGAAAVVAASLAPPDQRSRAVGYVMLGLTTAMLAGAPIAAWIGDSFGWRSAFAVVGLVAATGAVLIRFTVPRLPIDTSTSSLKELGALANPRLWLTLSVAGIGFGGLFCMFSYIKPALTTVSGLDASYVPLAMALFGVGGVAGTLIGARLADIALMRTIGGVLIYSILLLAVFSTMLETIPMALIGTFLLGGIVAIGPGLQVRLMDVAGDAKTLAAALTHSAINFANALGAWLGGVALTKGAGFSSLGWIGAILALGGLLLFGLSILAESKTTPNKEYHDG